MKLVSRVGFALATAALPATAVLVPAPAVAAVSPAVGKALQQAANAAKAGNNAGAATAIQQAQAAAKTPEERTKVAQMAAFVYTRAGNFAKAAAELEAIGAPASQLAPLYYQARQYDKAIAAAKKSGQTTIVAQSYLMQGKAADAAKIYSQIVDREPNNPTALQNLAGAQYKMGDRAGYLKTTQKLIRLDPTPNRWRALLLDLKKEPMSRDAKLGLYHLMRETETLTSAPDVQDFAKVAIVAGQPGVAADVVRSAGAVAPLTDPMNARLVDAATKRQAAAIAQAAAQARAPATALAAGNAYLGAGQYPQAIAAYGVAQKGPNPDEAALFKGIAQIRAGDKAAARATFDALKTGPMADVASMWSLYASTRK
jgi:tetratricopeptide (TPR) repeat protein